MTPTIITLAISSLLASGILFKHARILTLLAATATLWQAQWLFLTLIDRGLLNGQATQEVYLFGSFLLLTPWLFKLKKWYWPYSTPGSGKKDIAVLITLLIVLSAAWLIQQQNGFQNNDWITHGFYNGDTMTMLSLVQRSMLTDTLVTENPFAANEYLEYPTLLHGGIATLLKGLNITGNWFHYLPIFTYTQILFTIPIFFLLMDVVWPKPISRKFNLLAQTTIIIYVLALSWDAYIYPQSHFFLTNLFLLLTTLLFISNKKNDSGKCWHLTFANLVALILMLSNAVTGAAATALIITYYGTALLNRKESKLTRAIFIPAIIFWISIYLLWSPGDAAFGLPAFSYTAAQSLMKLAPIIIALAISILISEEKFTFLKTATILLMLMSVFTLLFSQRNIIIANAERFVYHALLIGFPLLLPTTIRTAHWLLTNLIYKTSGFINKFNTAFASFLVTAIFILPLLTSIASAHDNLMRKDEQKITLDHRDVLSNISRISEPQDIFLVQPDAPWAVPMFTGHTILRANYWLSPDDATTKIVNRAFRGDKQAQKKALQESDYLIISHEDLNNWNINEEQRIYRGGKISIFKSPY